MSKRNSVGAASDARVLPLVALLLFACVGFLAGCGASIEGGLGSEFKEQEKTGTGLATGPSKETGSIETGSGAVRFPRSAETLVSVATPGSTAYKIGPQDVLDISVYKVPDQTQSVQVSETGTVNLNVLGEVPAAGKTARELENILAAKLKKYLQKPQVRVYVKEYNSQRVTVEGAVKTPGVHTLKGKTSLLQFIAISGGLDPTSDSAVVVFRRTDGKRYAARFDIDEIRAGKAEDPAIMAGDVIVVSTSAIKSAWQDFLKALPIATAFRLFI